MRTSRLALLLLFLSLLLARPSAAGWTKAALEFADTDAAVASIALDSAGAWHAVRQIWTGTNEGNISVTHSRIEYLSAAQPPVLIASGIHTTSYSVGGIDKGNIVSAPSLAVGSNGTIHAVYVDMLEGVGARVIYRSCDAGVWSAPRTLWTQTREISKTGIACDARNLRHIVFASNIGLFRDTSIRYMDEAAIAAGTPVTIERVVSSTRDTWVTGPGIACDITGTVHLAYLKQLPGDASVLDVLYCTRTDAGWSSTQGVARLKKQLSYDGCAVVCEPNGVWHMAISTFLDSNNENADVMLIHYLTPGKKPSTLVRGRLSYREDAAGNVRVRGNEVISPVLVLDPAGGFRVYYLMHYGENPRAKPEGMFRRQPKRRGRL